MQYELKIDCATLGPYPVQAICSILQNQAEKLLRWHDTTRWSDTLVDAAGKSVGTAQLCASEPELNPIIQDILNAFLSPAPTAASGHTVYSWSGGLKEPVQCELEYEAAEKGSSDGGVPIEPDCPASMFLCKAAIKGVDITHLLSSKAISEIEASALADSTK